MTPEVIVDDRLATVLATAPAGAAGARTQYRQLLDILGRMPPDFPLPETALARLGAIERALPAAERAALIRAAPASLRHPGLVLRLAGQAPVVASAAVESARLDDWQWSALSLELPLAARGHLRHRRDLGPRTRAVLARLGIADLGLPAPAGEAATPAPAAEREDAEPEGIGAIVRRIEAFRRSRQAGTRQFGGDDAALAADPQLPLREFVGDTAAPPVTAIPFASDASGRISWAEGRFAPMLAGLRLDAGDPSAPARVDAATLRALRERRPVGEGRLEITGAPLVAGPWRLDATAAFDPATGRFTGYRGIIRRPHGGVAPTDSPADRLRQLLHELRTPVNAIQGFAELIQQQLFGPTPHHYRSLAATIAADSAAILAGFDEIERLVRLATGHAESLAGRCDLAALVTRLAEQIGGALAARDVGVSFDAAGPAPVALAEPEAERLVWRLLATLAAAAQPGETLALDLRAARDGLELALPLPHGLAQRDDARLFAVEPGDGEAGALNLLGGGFALRLAQAEARAAGGSLRREGTQLILRLPGLTPSAAGHSSGHSEGLGQAGGA